MSNIVALKKVDVVLYISTDTIQILDDTLYEVSEKFEVVLSSPAAPARLGSLTTASVIISGPNDGKTASLL